MKELKRVLKKMAPFIICLIIAIIAINKNAPNGNANSQNAQSAQTVEAAQPTQTAQTTAETGAQGSQQKETASPDQKAVEVEEDKTYTSKEEVSAYLHKFNHLPSNYLTKGQAKKQGWDSGDEYLSDAIPGVSIGGSKFGNREKKLPEQEGRQYYECDIDYKKGGRGAKRLVYSNDGLIFYTEDHYETFEQLY